MILASQSGMMIACRLIKETDKAWIINYNDKAYPKDVRVPKLSNRKLFNNVDEALEWMDN
jgi:hypothetical protein